MSIAVLDNHETTPSTPSSIGMIVMTASAQH